jgi:hypothetical protein
MGKRLMMVEGRDDSRVIQHFCKAHGIAIYVRGDRDTGERHDAEVVVEDGVEQLIQRLPIRLKEADVERLAVVVDADEDAASRWNQGRSIRPEPL